MDRDFESLWNELTDVITDENDYIESNWYIFSKGTSKFEIWHWLEDEFGVCIGELIN